MICQYQCSIHYDPPALTDFTGTEVVCVIEIYATHCHSANKVDYLELMHTYLSILLHE